MRFTGVQPLGQRRDTKILVLADRSRCMANHPMKTRLEGVRKNPWKRSSFVNESKKLTRQIQDRLPHSTPPFFPPDMSEPWVTDITDIKVHTTVPSLSGGDTQDDTVKQSLTLDMFVERHLQKVWIHVFTDGSATSAVTNEGQEYLSTSQEEKSHNKHGHWKALLQLLCRNSSPHAGCLLQIMTASRLSFSLMTSPSCMHIKTTSSQTCPTPYSKLQQPGGL